MNNVIETAADFHAFIAEMNDLQKQLENHPYRKSKDFYTLSIERADRKADLTIEEKKLFAERQAELDWLEKYIQEAGISKESQEYKNAAERIEKTYQEKCRAAGIAKGRTDAEKALQSGSKENQELLKDYSRIEKEHEIYKKQYAMMRDELAMFGLDGDMTPEQTDLRWVQFNHFLDKARPQKKQDQENGSDSRKSIKSLEPHLNIFVKPPAPAPDRPSSEIAPQ